MSKVFQLADGTLLEKSGRLMRADGSVISQMEPVDVVPMGGKPIGRGGRSEHTVDLTALSDHAAYNDARHVSLARGGEPVLMRNHAGDEMLITMDLAPSDVHVPGLLPNYAAGYRLSPGVADKVSPIVMVDRQSNYYPTWDKENSFNRASPNEAQPGASVAEISPTLSKTQYSCVERALASALTVETIANASGALKPWQKTIDFVQEKLRLERAFRVLTKATTSSNWDASVYVSLGASFGWKTGASADPVKDLLTMLEASWTDGSFFAMSRATRNILSRSPGFQKYFAYKSNVNAIPSGDQLSAGLDIPPILVDDMKSKNTSNNAAYVFDQVIANGAVLLIKDAPGVPADQMDISSTKTFRWTGGESPDGTMSGGWMVRTYFDPKRGAKGSYVVVCAHWDDEQQTSAFAGGLLVGVQLLRVPHVRSTPRPRRTHACALREDRADPHPRRKNHHERSRRPHRRDRRGNQRRGLAPRRPQGRARRRRRGWPGPHRRAARQAVGDLRPPEVARLGPRAADPPGARARARSGGSLNGKGEPPSSPVAISLRGTALSPRFFAG